MAHSEQAVKFNGYLQKDVSFENTEAQEALSTSGIGFRFVRYFLLTILCVVGSMIALIGLLGWQLGMEITVAGQGRLQPTARYEVKAQRSGLIQTVHVQHGQEIKQGDLMLTLDDTDLRTELEQIEHELAMNQNRRVALVAELQRERAVLETEIARAEVEYETAQLQLEQVRQEYQIYRKYAPYREDGNMRPPVDTLIPIRVHQTRVEGTKVEIERAKRRLAALDNRKQELEMLKQTYEKLQVSHRLVKTRLEQMKIYAPVSGTVLTRDLDKREGDRIEAGEAVIELAELHSWQAEVMIQEVDIPKVKEGHKVRIYVNAFPHMEYKIFEGRVTDVPRKPEPITPMGAGLVPGGMSTVYPVKISVIDPHLSDGECPLAYGMGVEAKIVTERGPIVDLLWKKFLKTVGKIGRPEIYRLEDRGSR